MKIQLDIKHCSECPFYSARRHYTADSWEYEQNLHCNKADKFIAKFVDMFHFNKVEIPKWCPIKVK